MNTTPRLRRLFLCPCLIILIVTAARCSHAQTPAPTPDEIKAAQKVLDAAAANAHVVVAPAVAPAPVPAPPAAVAPVAAAVAPVLTPDQELAASQKVIDAATAAANLKTAKEAFAANGPSVPYRFYLSSGSTFLNPYTVNLTSSNATLVKSGNTTAGFLDIAFIDRFVTRQVGDGTSVPKSRTLIGGGGIEGPKGAHWVNPFTRSPDLEGHVGFVFDNGTSTSNYSASTIAGTGDFYSQAIIGLPFVQRLTTKHAEQLTLDIGGGVTTDKNFLAVHPNAFTGLGFQESFTVPELSTNAVLLTGRFGYGMVDTPYLTSNQSLNVALENTLPKFTLKGAPYLGLYLLIPVNNTVNLTVGANAYIKKSPAPWSITIGATIAFPSLAKALGLGGS